MSCGTCCFRATQELSEEVATNSLSMLEPTDCEPSVGQSGWADETGRNRMEVRKRRGGETVSRPIAESGRTFGRAGAQIPGQSVAQPDGFARGSQYNSHFIPTLTNGPDSPHCIDGKNRKAPVSGPQPAPCWIWSQAWFKTASRLPASLTASSGSPRAVTASGWVSRT